MKSFMLFPAAHQKPLQNMITVSTLSTNNVKPKKMRIFFIKGTKFKHKTELTTSIWRKKNTYINRKKLFPPKTQYRDLTFLRQNRETISNSFCLSTNLRKPTQKFILNMKTKQKMQTTSKKLKKKHFFLSEKHIRRGLWMTAGAVISF